MQKRNIQEVDLAVVQDLAADQSLVLVIDLDLGLVTGQDQGHMVGEEDHEPQDADQGVIPGKLVKRYI